MAALLMVACSGSSPTAPQLGDTLSDRRPPIPASAFAPYYADTPTDPASVDELLAEANRIANNDDIVISADVTACALATIWAQPEPDRVLVGYEPDDAIDCDAESSFRSIFIVPTSGTSDEGTWDYGLQTPPVVTERQTAGS